MKQEIFTKVVFPKEFSYEISNFGNLRNTRTGLILKGSIKKNGYREFCLQENGERVFVSGHRLTFFNFNQELIEQAENKQMVINHKNGNKSDNNLDNLEFISATENNLHAIYDLNINLKNNIKKVYVFDDEFNVINTFPSLREAGRQFGVSHTSVRIAIERGNKTAGFYVSYSEKHPKQK